MRRITLCAGRIALENGTSPEVSLSFQFLSKSFLHFQIQVDVISNYGFTCDGEGVIQFIQHVKLYERDDTEIERLHALVKAYSIPPLQTQMNHS